MAADDLVEALDGLAFGPGLDGGALAAERGQMVEFDPFSLRSCGGLGDDLAQLAEIAGPGVFEEAGEGFGG